MSDSWNTKYGSRRVRQDPPTLQEAIFAASGLTSDPGEQAETAAPLMGLPAPHAPAASPPRPANSAKSPPR